MEQEQWNSEVPPDYEEKLKAKRRIIKERRARLAKEMAARAGGAGEAHNNLAGFGEPLAAESLPEPAPSSGARAPRPPIYVPPSRSIPQHHSGISGVALRKSKKLRKAKAKARKSRRR